jgi:hypothetical protein
LIDDRRDSDRDRDQGLSGGSDPPLPEAVGSDEFETAFGEKFAYGRLEEEIQRAVE